uniref:WGS project CBMD000000000 data, contig CS3427_c000930 n=1 Tax=Fusarium pseudograminearum CS3427 TaxID=1318457 RepID=A0A096PC31_FUSPS|nr:unnamed protein product [Fusarium pseudograminearum CS3427]
MPYKTSLSSIASYFSEEEAIIALIARSPSDCLKEPSLDLLALSVREGSLGIPLHKELAALLH